MKIAYISDQFLPQTATDTEQSLNMIAALGEAGAEVTLVVPRPVRGSGVTTMDLAEYYQVPGNFEVVSAVLPASPRGVTKALHAGRSVLGEVVRRADVVYTRNLPTVVAAAIRGVGPVVYETYRPWPDQNRVVGEILKRLARADGVAGAILHSALAAKSFEKVGFSPDRLLVAHNAWDPKKLEPRLETVEARRKCALPQKRQIVTYAGKIEPRKGVGVVLDIASALPEVLFVLVGSEGNGELERTAAGLDNVVVRPWLPFNEVTPYLYASDVLLIPPTVNPLHTETTVLPTVLPLKTFLYMATGRPIFSGDGPDMKEVLTDGETACLVPADDSQVAVRRLRELLEDPELQHKLGAAAREKVNEWTWESRARRVLEFIERLD